MNSGNNDSSILIDATGKSLASNVGSYTPSDVQVLKTLGDRQKATELRGHVYSKLFPGVVEPGKPDIYDFNSIVWAAKKSDGTVVATARLAYDDPECGLPSEPYLKQYLNAWRKNNVKLAEFGRFINVEEGRAKKHLTRAFYGRLLFHACCAEIDVVLIVAPATKMSLYISRFGASLLCADINHDFGSGTPFAAYAWDIRRTKMDFFAWILGNKNDAEV